MSADPTSADANADSTDQSDQHRRDGVVLGDGEDVATTVDCFDATVSVRAGGALPGVTLRRARQVARELDGAVGRGLAHLEDRDTVRNVHVARLVERAIEYHRRTDGAFDVRDRRGVLRAYTPGDGDGSTAFDGNLPDGKGAAFAGAPVDLADLALPYVLDRIAATVGRSGRVTAPGLASSAGGTGINAPGGHDFGRLSGDWSVATTAGDDLADRISLTDGDVVVLAERDCTEAAALRTVLARRGAPAARELAADWDGATALVVRAGVVRTADGFDDHLD